MLIDVSHHQNDAGPINWATADPAIDGGYVKITEGAGYVDPKWRINHDGLMGIGDHVGAYHFASLGDPIAEANHFADVYLSAQWTLRPVLDIETTGSTAAWLKSFRAQFRKRVGTNAFRVYTSYSLLKGALAPAGWIDTDTDIWAARYNATLGWTHPQLVLWQNSSTAAVPGFVGSVDIDQYQNGWTPAADLGRGFLMALSDAEQGEALAALRIIRDQITGGINQDGTLKGWSGIPGKPDGTLVDMARFAARQFADRFPSRVKGSTVTMTLGDAILDTNAFAFNGLNNTIDLKTAVAALAVGGVNVNELAAALTEALGPEVAKAIGEKLVA